MTTPRKRKLPRRELPWIGTLLEKLPYSKLPTKGVAIRRLMFELENSTLAAASTTVKEELVQLWTYAGYGDILHDSSYIQKQVQALHTSYKDLCKIPLQRRTSPSFLAKEKAFLSSLDTLLDSTKKKEHYSHLITPVDRDFLLLTPHATISSVRDTLTKATVERRLDRLEKARLFAQKQTSPLPGPAFSPDPDSSSPLLDSSEEEFSAAPTPKRPRTDVSVSRDILKKLGPAADRLNLSNTQLTGIVAAMVNHGGGDLEDLSLSKATARRQRAASRKTLAAEVKKDFVAGVGVGQINFDGKLMKNLEGYGQVNRWVLLLAPCFLDYSQSESD